MGGRVPFPGRFVPSIASNEDPSDAMGALVKMTSSSLQVSDSESSGLGDDPSSASSPSLSSSSSSVEEGDVDPPPPSMPHKRVKKARGCRKKSNVSPSQGKVSKLAKDKSDTSAGTLATGHTYSDTELPEALGQTVINLLLVWLAHSPQPNYARVFLRFRNCALQHSTQNSGFHYS